MISKIYFKLLFFLFLGILYVFSLRPVFAQACAGGNTTEVYFCSKNSGTYWGVSGTYREQNSPFSTITFTNIWTDSSNVGSACGLTSGYYNYFPIANYAASNKDTISWHTACVDPSSYVNPIKNNYCKKGGGFIYTDSFNVTCSSNSLYGNPASCNTPNGWGYVQAGTWCPSGPYCMHGGNTWDTSSGAGHGQCPGAFNSPATKASSSTVNPPASCGGSGSCTYNQCGLQSYNGGSYGICNSTVDSSSCGGAVISGTSMCSNNSYSCSPSGPAVTLTTSCSSGKARISASYGAVTHGDGNYDLRWRVSGGSFANVCSPTNPYSITNLADSTTYEVQVRGNTVAGYNGPTNFTSKTITTPACTVVTLPPPTCTLSANPTSIQVNGTSSLTASCTAGAGGGSISYSWPAPSIGSVGNVITATNTYTAPSTAGTATVTVKGCQSADGQCATASTNITVSSVPTFTISGNVFVDQDNSGATKNAPPDTNYAGITVNAGSSGSNVTNSSGNYTISGLPAGTYSVSIPVPSGYSVPVRTQSITVGPNSSNINFRLIPAGAIVIDVFKDYNGNGVDDGVSEPAYSGATATVTGTGAGTYTSANCSTQSANVLLCTTDSTGQALTGNLPQQSYTITLTPVPSGYTLTTANNVSRNSLPTTVNFGLHPAAPTCSGGLTANPTSVTPGQTSTLTAVGCSSPVGTTITYSWPAPDYGTTADVNNPVTTWTSPNPWWTQVNAHPGVFVCLTGTIICTPYSATITINPRFSVSGSVFVDQDKDQLQNNGDPNYSGPITISPNPAGVTITYPSSGTYLISNMPAGNYVIAYTSLPAGYQLTYPQNGPPPSFSITVGNASSGFPCNEVSNSANCDVNGNITNLSYGITNSVPWIQCIGGDCTGSQVTTPGGGGFTDKIPPGATCTSYASIQGGGGSPGIIYSGGGTADFGSGQASPNPYNWVVGGLNYPEPININSPLVTSYAYVNSVAQQSGTIHDISSYCGAGGISDCHLSASLVNGFYISNGDLKLTGPSFTFPGNTASPKNYIIMVNGDLNINTEIHTPIGDTAFFTTSGDINVAANVGESTISSTRSNIEGYFSTDKSFNVLGASSCPTVDLRLNVAGSIVVNASLTGGSFVNSRDLCAGDLQCPVFSVSERPDFILYSPEYLKVRRVWQEVAP